MPTQRTFDEGAIVATGKQHGIVTIALSVPSGIAGYALSQRIDFAVVTMLGCLTGLFVDPDLDVNGLTKSRMRWGRIALPLVYVWSLLWSLYSWVIPHRHWVSHLPIIGTAGRLSYLTAILSLISMGKFWQWPFLLPIDLLFCFFIGLAVSDMAHWIMDGMPL